MDRQDTLRNILVAAAVFCGLWLVGEKLIPPPRPIGQNGHDATTSTQPPVSDGAIRAIDRAGTSTDTGMSADRPAASGSTASDGGFSIIEADTEVTVAIGASPDVGSNGSSADSPYRMRLTLSNVGASVESATMTDHTETLGDPARYVLLTRIGDPARGWYRSFPIEAVNIDGISLSLRDRKWKVVGENGGVTACKTPAGDEGEGATFQIDIHGDGAPVLELTRSFCLPRQGIKTGRHDFTADLTVRNVSNEEHQVVVTYDGGIGVPQADSFRDDRVVDWGVRQADGRIVGQRSMPRSVFKKGILPLFTPATVEPGTTFSWAATGNKYFTCTIAPTRDSTTDQTAGVSEVSAVDADGSGMTKDDAIVRFVTRPYRLAAQQARTYANDVYLGEKDGHAFQSVETYRQRNYNFQITKGFGFCTFTWLVELMIWLLNTVHKIIPNFGIAIIFMVLIVRTLLHPITKKGQINMVRMQSKMGEMGPKMEELKKRYANDKARMQQETMALYRDGGINPATQVFGCLPMVIQMPIWIALYISLSNNIDMRHEPFFWWIRDLTAPDALYTFASPLVVPLVGWHLPAFNFLPILMSISMFLQQKLQPKPKPNPNASQQQRDQQQMMQKMMPMMSIMMLVFFYKMPSGLTLYIFTSSLFGTIEQYRIRKHIKEQEQAGTLHKPTRPKKEPGSGPPRSMPGWFERLQKKVEQAQKVQKNQRAKPRR